MICMMCRKEKVQRAPGHAEAAPLEAGELPRPEVHQIERPRTAKGLLFFPGINGLGQLNFRLGLAKRHVSQSRLLVKGPWVAPRQVGSSPTVPMNLTGRTDFDIKPSASSRVSPNFNPRYSFLGEEWRF